MRTLQFLVLALLASLFASMQIGREGVASAQSDAASAINRLPGSANAIFTLNVAKMLQSPMAKQMDWQAKLIKGQADRPLAVPATSKRVTIAASLHPVAMKTVWEAAIVELQGKPPLVNILRAQGGYMDSINGKNAAWTLNDVFYIELGPNTLGIVRPGQRQYVTRWLDSKNSSSFSTYLQSAQASSGDADAVFAIDLEDMVGPTAVMYAADSGDLPSLENFKNSRTQLLTALGSARGIRLNMVVKDQINGELTVDFERDVSALGDLTKGFVIDVLKATDLYEPTVDAWDFKASGKTIVGKGVMSPDVLNRLLALLSPPTHVQGVDVADAAAPAGAAAPAAPAPAGAPSGNDLASASQAYYKTISKILDGLSAKASPTESATWLISKARVIEQLPIVNVDPELVGWGNMVAESLNRAAQELALGQQKAKIASMGVAAPAGYVDYADNGGGNDTADTRAAFRNAQAQRRQVAQNERGAAAERALNIIQQVLPTRGKIRADMTQKYGVEF